MTATVLTSAGRTGRPSSVFVGPYSPEVAILGYHPIVTTVAASAAYPAAQRALFFPIRVFRSETVRRFFWVNGTTASTDDVQVGLYSMTGAAIQLGTSTGTNHGTLAAGTSACQFDNITDFVIQPGEYLLAIWCSGTTTHMIRTSPNFRQLEAVGCYQQSSLSTGLPTSATLAAPATAYVPVFGMSLRASP